MKDYQQPRVESVPAREVLERLGPAMANISGTPISPDGLGHVEKKS
ncbi:MAG: hypothetical protein GY716_03345 [bacterium]|nr:hypothetical protein [bacterium]